MGLKGQRSFDMVSVTHMRGLVEQAVPSRAGSAVDGVARVRAANTVTGAGQGGSHGQGLRREPGPNADLAVGPQQWVEFEYDWQGRRVRQTSWPREDKTAGCRHPQPPPRAAGAGVRGAGDPGWRPEGLTPGYCLKPFQGFEDRWWKGHTGPNAGTHFCAYDGNGNVMALVSAADGSVAARYEYGPFGEVLRATGPMAKVNPFRFSTKFQDDESDLLYYGYRYYNASMGRWLSRDPIGERGGLNLYGFVGNDAIRRIDPFGLDYYIYIVKGTCGVNHRVLVGDDGNGNSYEIDIQPLAKKWYQSYRRVCGKGVISYTPRTGAATNWISGKLEKHGDTTPAQDAAMAAKAKSMDNASITYCLGIQDCRAIEDCLLWGPVGQRISDQLQLLWEVIVEQISPPR